LRNLPSLFPTVLLALAAVLGTFSYWGLFTEAGRHAFDEIDGMYPFFAGGLAVVLLLIFFALMALRPKG
jgi:hypothetical protein